MLAEESHIALIRRFTDELKVEKGGGGLLEGEEERGSSVSPWQATGGSLEPWPGPQGEEGSSKETVGNKRALQI